MSKKHWRNSSEYRKWKKAVLLRDNLTCQVCGSKKKLQAHHINSGSYFPELRYDVDNGITLCRNCHSHFHNDYKKSYRAKCTLDDWKNFIALAEYLKEVLCKEGE